ncbi:MAG: hypothetical protein WCF84_15820 [Anaerolineae bacterium]
MSTNHFQRAEDEYFRLKGLMATGRVTHEQFEAALKDLMFQDVQGRWWMLGAETGQWHVYDGQQWVLAQPPSPGSGQPPPVPSVPVPPAPPVKRTSIWIPLAGALALVLFVVIGILLFASQHPPTTVIVMPYSSETPGRVITSPAGTVPAARTPAPDRVSAPQYLAPQEVAASADALAAAIADLNRAELKFLQDTRNMSHLSPYRGIGLALPQAIAPNVTLLDGDLREMAASAMRAGGIARALGWTAAAQEGDSGAVRRLSAQYFGIARTSYAFVVEAQNMRDELNRGDYKVAEWNNRVAEYGLRLWNPAVQTGPTQAAPSNPFLSYQSKPVSALPKQMESQAETALKQQLGAGTVLRSWVAASKETVQLDLVIPPPVHPVSAPLDAALNQQMTSAAGQSQGDIARQVAAAQLASMSPDPASPSGTLKVSAPAGMVIARPDLGEQALPPFWFEGGLLSALTLIGGDGNEGIVLALVQSAAGTPRVEAQVPVKPDPKPAIALTIEQTNMRYNGAYPDAPYEIEVAVTWTATGPLDQVFLVCRGSDSANQTRITQAHGMQSFTVHTGEGPQELMCYTGRQSEGDLLSYATLSYTSGLRVLEEWESSKDATAFAKDSKEEEAQRLATATAMAATQHARTATQLVMNATGTVVSNEVYGTQTAEFVATVTQIARLTAQAGQAQAAANAKATQDAIAGNVFVMNGTFNLSFGGAPYVGPIKLSVDLNTGKASAFFQAESGFKYQDKCDPSVTRTSHAYFEGNLGGTVNVKTGELSGFTGPMKGTSGSDGDCGTPGVTVNLSPQLVLTGVVDLKNHTAQGRISCAAGGCDGDWHAGQ